MDTEAVVFLFVCLLCLNCILMSCTRKFKCVHFIFLLGAEKVVAGFFFGHVLIFLPDLGQGDLEIALIDCSGNCSQLMNTIK